MSAIFTFLVILGISAAIFIVTVIIDSKNRVFVSAIYQDYQRRFAVSSFRREIIIILLIKLALIYGLWSVFFSSPIDKTLSDEDVSVNIVGMNANSANKKEIVSD